MMMSQKDIGFDDTHGSNHNAYLILLFQIFFFSLTIFLVIYMMFLLLDSTNPFPRGKLLKEWYNTILYLKQKVARATLFET
jgi:hypothetical protein